MNAVWANSITILFFLFIGKMWQALGMMNLDVQDRDVPWSAAFISFVELGDVMKIKSIAKELKPESDTMASFCNELAQLAENFDFNGIQKFVFGLDKIRISGTFIP